VKEKCTAEPTEDEEVATPEGQSMSQHKKKFYFKHMPPEGWFSSYCLVTIKENVQSTHFEFDVARLNSDSWCQTNHFKSILFLCM
jgi:hypothetical protein